MIFVSLGTQIYQFDRLIKELDKLVGSGFITDNIFAQIGTANYYPKYFEYKQFLPKEEFEKKQDQARLIISHGGTGALISAAKKGKNIIAVPRLAKYGEHTDDHQIQVVKVLEREGYLRAVFDIKDLGDTIKNALKCPIEKKYNRKSMVLPIIIDYIEKEM